MMDKHERTKGTLQGAVQVLLRAGFTREQIIALVDEAIKDA